MRLLQLVRTWFYKISFPKIEVSHLKILNH